MLGRRHDSRLVSRAIRPLIRAGRAVQCCRCKGEGLPCGQPFTLSNRGPVGTTARRINRRRPRSRRKSRPPHPRTADEDNETLDHLLSVVDDGGNVNDRRLIRKGFGNSFPISRCAPVSRDVVPRPLHLDAIALSFHTAHDGLSANQFAHRAIEAFERERIHSFTC
jgi:hypothetical protein